MTRYKVIYTYEGVECCPLYFKGMTLIHVSNLFNNFNHEGIYKLKSIEVLEEISSYDVAVNMIKNDKPICKDHLDFIIDKCDEYNIKIDPITIVLLQKIDNEYFKTDINKLY